MVKTDSRAYVIAPASGVIGVATITITDDINTQNKDEIFKIMDKSDLIIHDKFEMPPSQLDMPLNINSKTMQKVYKELDALKNEVTNKKSKYITNETQLNNFQAKVLFWCSKLFKDIIATTDEYGRAHVTIQNNNISKHECLFINILNKAGVSFLIISNKNECDDILKNNDNVVINRYGTSENIMYAPTVPNKQIDLNSLNKAIPANIYITSDGVDIVNEENNNKVATCTTLEEVETAIYDNKSKIKIIISGTGNYRDTCDFYGKINRESKKGNGIILFTNGFEKPTFDETKSFPKITIDRYDYVIGTTLQFLKIEDKNLKDSIIKALKTVFNKVEFDKLKYQIFSNKILYTICILNKILNNYNNEYIAYYGKVSGNDELVFNVLNYVDAVSYIIMTSDKSKVVQLESNTQLLELENSTEIFEMPTIDNRESSTTLAAKAQRRIDNTLYSGDTLGMYKPGQFRTCKTKRFSTIPEETILWWNKELYIRPGFEVQGDIALLPTLFKVIKGVDDGQQYLKNIQQLACGKTILCNNINELNNLVTNNSSSHIVRGTDINNTMFNEQKPFYKDGKLQRDLIRSGKNYSYGMLELHKQNLIFDKIEVILQSDLLNKKLVSKTQDYEDLVLNTLLNLDKQIVQYINWFEFYTYNPNIIVILTNEQKMTMEQVVLLIFLDLIGFDILIYVPSGFLSIENIVGKDFMYDTHVIGEYMYDIQSNINVTNNIIPQSADDSGKNKKGFFSKLFSKGD